MWWCMDFFLFPGPDRGVCRCRKCQCKPKYHGANCDKKNCTYFPPETQCKKDADSVRQLFCRDPFTDCFLSYIIIKKRPASYFRCSVSFQEICGGSERGECKPDDENCYKCVCKSAYDGTYCEKCPVSGAMTFFSHCYSIIHWTWLGGRCHSLQNPSPKEQLKIYAM